MNNDLFHKLRKYEQQLMGQQKRLTQYLLRHFDEISFKTVAEISKKAGVSDATVIRLSRVLGYDGFPQLRNEFRGAILEKNSPYERFHRTIDLPNNFAKLISLEFEEEIKNLKKTQESLEIANISKIIKGITQAKRKYVVGLRASCGCAYMLGRFLSQILPEVTTLLHGDSSLFEGLRVIGKDDIIIAICYPRYTKATIDAIQFARDRQALTVAITDSLRSPLAQLSHYTLTAPTNSCNFTNSYTGCISIINVLVTLIIHMQKAETEIYLKEWDDAIKRFNFQ